MNPSAQFVKIEEGKIVLSDGCRIDPRDWARVLRQIARKLMVEDTGAEADSQSLFLNEAADTLDVLATTPSL